MKIAISLFKIDRPTGAPQDFDITEPGTILGSSIVVEDAPVILVGKDQPDKIPRDVLVVQTDPDAPKRRRRFHLVPAGAVLSPKDESRPIGLSFVTLMNSPMFGPLAVFEEEVSAAELAAIALATAGLTPDDSDRPAAVVGEIEARPVPLSEIETPPGGTRAPQAE